MVKAPRALTLSIFDTSALDASDNGDHIFSFWRISVCPWYSRHRLDKRSREKEAVYGVAICFSRDGVWAGVSGEAEQGTG